MNQIKSPEPLGNDELVFPHGVRIAGAMRQTHGALPALLWFLAHEKLPPHSPEVCQ